MTRSQPDHFHPGCRPAPIRRGQPGDRPRLDADNDGVAYKPWHGRRQIEE
ncbi:MAG: excalibur calcium-binding domain-containing protein [Beijerinckiaceae bacterium]